MLKLVQHDSLCKKIAFTLAEVLITLGIIGIVAALTIPNLIANTNSKRFISQFKKSLSTLSQAGLMGQAHNDSNYATLSQQCMGETDSLANGDSTFCGLFNVTLKGAKYVGDISKLTAKNKAYTIDGNTPNGYTGYFLSDGALVYFPSTGSNCTRKSPCQGYIDVNGATLPNKFVRCEGHENDSEFYSGECTLAKNNKNDIFPVYFYDSVVSPAGSAARALLKLVSKSEGNNNNDNANANSGKYQRKDIKLEGKNCYPEDSEEANNFASSCYAQGKTVIPNSFDEDFFRNGETKLTCYYCSNYNYSDYIQAVNENCDAPESSCLANCADSYAETDEESWDACREDCVREFNKCTVNLP